MIHDHTCNVCDAFASECDDACLEYLEPGEVVTAQSGRYGAPSHPLITGICATCN